ncbi:MULTISPECIES: hypothetical protein [Bradyrhizobium]|uniref:hypothetical protein n=1 Tax=Bradyrhizobium elkanii TaxID=29448 RepID=UPI0012BBEF33|nr:hypothetical protein [Bradyrhizobium elkanii]
MLISVVIVVFDHAGSKPSGISGLLASSLELQAGQGAPGPPQLHASRPSHGFIGWFSQIQWQLQQRAHHLMSEILSQPFEEAMAQRGRNKLPAAIDSNSSGSSGSATLSVGLKELSSLTYVVVASAARPGLFSSAKAVECGSIAGSMFHHPTNDNAWLSGAGQVARSGLIQG